MTALRRFALPIGIVAAVLLFWMENPWSNPPDSIGPVVTIAFWVLAIVLIVALFEDRKAPDSQYVDVEGPGFARFLFSNTRAGLVWLPIRLFLGFQWLEAGWHKLNDPAWTDGGKALLGFWQAAVKIPDTGRPLITFDWYRDFLNVLINGHHEGWFSWLIILGELAIGLGLLFGVLTGIAAFFGALMNMSFLLAGSASSNPVLFTLAIGLILAWRVAGWYGLDRYLLPKLGAPWSPGEVFRGGSARPVPG